MGRKVLSQVQVKISKSKLNSTSLMKVLKPKVYITDTSNFKTLVQNLTGISNGSPTHHEVSAPRKISLIPKVAVPVIDVDHHEDIDHDHIHIHGGNYPDSEGSSSSSMEYSSFDDDASAAILEVCNNNFKMSGSSSSSMEYSSFDDDASAAILEVCNNNLALMQYSSEEIINCDQASCYEPLPNLDQLQEDYSMVLRDLQSSCLLDNIDVDHNYEYYYPSIFNNVDDQVTIFDYELSGLL